MLGIRAFLVFSLGCALIGSVLAGSALAQRDGDDKEYPNEVYFDFRGKPLPPELTVKPDGADRFIKSEPQGLRVTLPKDRKDLAPLELITRVGIDKDFEITATLEILHADNPDDGFGVGASLFINKADPATEAASVGRLSRPGGAEILFWDQGFGKPGEQLQFDFDSRPCTDKQLHLRLKRTGSQLAYFVGAGLDGETFEALQPKNFGPNDIERVLLRVTTGRQPLSVDVRLIDLRIRSGRVPDPNVPLAGATGAGGRSDSRLWLAAALLLVLATTICLAIAFRRRCRADPGIAEAGTTPGSYRCAGCGQKLKVKAEFAGKTVKCPKCGHALLVPATPTDQPASHA
jgi:DNA-directed RNA polymerase subunit RPC12/RpoP